MGIFGFIGLFSGIASRHVGLIIGGFVYTFGAGIAFKTGSFAPLVVAFIIAIILGKLGFDPSAKHNKQMSDVELLEKALPKDMKRTHTLEEVKKGMQELRKYKGL